MTGGSALPLSIWVTGATLPEVERERGSFVDLIRTTVGSAWAGPWAVFDALDEADNGGNADNSGNTNNAGNSDNGDTAHAYAHARNADNAANPLPDPEQVAGVIITGSPARIADQAPWMQRAQAHARILAERGVPVLGICFGHQLLGAALGGRSGPNPRGREIGTAVVRRVDRHGSGGSERDSDREGAYEEDALLGDAPARFLASMTHLDTVLEVPPGSVVLAETARDRCAAVRFAPRVWGVQFHPEMDGDVIARYITARAESLRSEGLDPEALLAECRDTPESAELLRRFARICTTDATYR